MRFDASAVVGDVDADERVRASVGGGATGVFGLGDLQLFAAWLPSFDFTELGMVGWVFQAASTPLYIYAGALHAASNLKGLRNRSSPVWGQCMLPKMVAVY